MRTLVRHPFVLLLAAALTLIAAPPLQAEDGSETAQPNGPGPQAQAPEPGLRKALRKAANDAKGFKNRFDAEVWLTDMSTRLQPLVPDTQRRLALLRAVHREAKRAKLSPNLVLAVIQVESNFKRYAISWAGAEGLMQVMPFWVKEIGREHDNLFDMDTNLRYGCTILRYYMDAEDGDLGRALARYNGSAGKYWYPARVNAALRKRWYKQ